MLNLLNLHTLLNTATCPEDVFGPLAGTPDAMLTQMKKTFRAMAFVSHPDQSPANAALAEKTFQLLETWRHRAEERIRERTYGQANPGRSPVPMTTRKGMYLVHEPLFQGDYYTLYRCTRADRTAPQNLVLKIVRESRDNDLLEKEVDTLRTLAREEARGSRYFPELVDAFLSTDGSIQRQALILGTAGCTVRLTDIHSAYPTGLDPRDAAWIFNRILEALWFTHEGGLVHGAVVPTNLFVNLDSHGLLLFDWAFATTGDLPISAISGSYAPWYPIEVLRKNPASPATDIFMAARCLVYLLGGDPILGTVPHSVPSVLQRFIKGCLLPAVARRPSDAGELREEFDGCLAQLYGKRVFRPLAMPA